MNYKDKIQNYLHNIKFEAIFLKSTSIVIFVPTSGIGKSIYLPIF